MTITITNEKGEKLDIIVSKKTANRIIDAVYPDRALASVSKGYIELVNHLNK